MRNGEKAFLGRSLIHLSIKENINGRKKRMKKPAVGLHFAK